MENLRYRLECFWREHGETIKRYAFWVFCLFLGLARERPLVAAVGALGVCTLFCYDRWLHVWAERGRKILNKEDPNSP
jgi:hypothetical protein